jgi:hypothetical protein
MRAFAAQRKSGIGNETDVARGEVKVNVPIVRLSWRSRKLHQGRIFGETLKRERINDSDSPSRAIEVADEFSVKG